MTLSSNDVFIAPRRLRALARTVPDRVPLTVAQPSGPPVGMSCAEWDARADAVARGLLDRGVVPGDRLALLFAGMAWDEYAAAYSAVHRVGATALHLSPELGEREIRRRLVEVGPVGVLHGPGVTPAPPPGSTAWVTRARDCAVPGGAEVEVDLGPETISDVLYTSGTTGPPKAMLVPHGNLGFGRGLNRVAAETFDAGTPIVAPMPLGSSASAGMVAIFAATTTSTIVVCPPDDPEQVAAAIARTRAGSVMATPSLVMAMIDHEVWERHDLTCLTAIGVASAQLPPRYGRTLAEHLPQAGVMVTYGGGSEAIPANIRGAYDPAHPGRVGRPSPGTTLRLPPPDAAEPAAPAVADVAPGEVGRVVLRHEAPPRRFLDPANDRGVYVDGWVVTNDLALIDPADGQVRVFDRGEDAIPTPGGLVSSLAVESALFEHPDVRDAAAVAGPAGGPRIVGFVVLRPGSAATVDDVLAAARRGAGSAPLPDRVHLVAALPRGPQGGKVLKRELRARAATGEPSTRPERRAHPGGILRRVVAAWAARRGRVRA